jgi:hypothetical protein
MEFKAAFQDGLKSAQDAETARREIGEVFMELNKEISEASNGTLTIKRMLLPITPEHVTLAIALVLKNSPPESVIAASNPKAISSEWKKLCGWSSDRAGYPCKLIYASSERYCENKQALKKCLADLLRDPVVGETLFQLMNLEVKGKKEMGKSEPQEENNALSVTVGKYRITASDKVGIAAPVQGNSIVNIERKLRKR